MSIRRANINVSLGGCFETLGFGWVVRSSSRYRELRGHFFGCRRNHATATGPRGNLRSGARTRISLDSRVMGLADWRLRVDSRTLGAKFPPAGAARKTAAGHDAGTGTTGAMADGDDERNRAFVLPKNHNGWKTRFL